MLLGCFFPLITSGGVARRIHWLCVTLCGWVRFRGDVIQLTFLSDFLNLPLALYRSPIAHIDQTLRSNDVICPL